MNKMRLHTYTLTNKNLCNNNLMKTKHKQNHFTFVSI